MGIALFLVKNRILSCVAGVAFSKREGLSGEAQPGRRSLMADGSITFPERMCAPISPAFSSKRTRNSSFPASLASCLRRMAALSPAGPKGGQLYNSAENGTNLPPPMMQTSTSSVSRSCCRASNGLSTSAKRLHGEVENDCLQVGF